MRSRGSAQLQYGLKMMLQTIFKVAHATILSAYSQALA